ncbi:MAG TPA: cell wall hydrolase [Sphingomicrobium sp.]|nr:cell wall hydrolase [Sphingomicrobium sp.]
MTANQLSPASLWRQHPRKVAGLTALALAGAIAAGGSAWSSPRLAPVDSGAVEIGAPAAPPLLVRDLAPTDAASLNQQIPLVGGPNPAARPFSLAKLDSATRAQALECLTSAAYYEAGNESDDGIRSVAQVVLNRVRHPAFPSTVCGVVYQGSTRSTGCQFTFTCDGSLQRRPDRAGWERSRRIAEAALNGDVFGPVGLATHYHASYVVPYWASSLAKNAVVGAHLFYRWAGGWGRPAAFTQAYARQEPSPAALKAAALAAISNRPEELAADGLAGIPGATAEKGELGRIAVRFNLAEAREAVEKAARKPYVERVEASRNLRWTLSGAGAGSEQKPLGRHPAGQSVSVASKQAPGPENPGASAAAQDRPGT